MRNEKRSHPKHPAIRWALPPQEAEDGRPATATEAIREGEVFFRDNSLGRYRLSVRDLLVFLQRFRIAS